MKEIRVVTKSIFNIGSIVSILCSGLHSLSVYLASIIILLNMTYKNVLQDLMLAVKRNFSYGR